MAQVQRRSGKDSKGKEGRLEEVGREEEKKKAEATRSSKKATGKVLSEGGVCFREGKGAGSQLGGGTGKSPGAWGDHRVKGPFPGSSSLSLRWKATESFGGHGDQIGGSNSSTAQASEQ